MPDTIIYNFPTDSTLMGQQPQGNVTLSGNVMYGYSSYGGAYGNAGATNYGYGVLFKANLSTNIVTKLHDFGASSVPYAPGGTREDGIMVSEVDTPVLIGSKLYGICAPLTGGSGYKIYSLNTDGSDYKLLYFTLDNLTGGLFYLNNLLYGTSTTGGDNFNGYIFSFNPSTNSLTVLYSFSASTNTQPNGSLNGYLEGSNYVVYGTCLSYNGSNTPTLYKYNITTNTFTSIKTFPTSYGAVFYQVIFNSNNSKLYGAIIGSTYDSTVYSMDTNDLSGSTYTVLKTLNTDGSEGSNINTRLLLNGSVLYGSCTSGQLDNRFGNIFSINTNGTNFNVEYSFGASPDASSPFGICLYNSNIYGISYYGGTGTSKRWNGQKAGAIFSLGVGGGGGAPCFTETTKILTQDGYKEIRHLLKEDKLVTADGRLTSFKLFHFKMNKTDLDSAPYCVPAGSLGESYPESDLHISGLHAIQDKNGLWQFPVYLKKTNPLIKQFDIGKPIIYYHIECPDYFKDNLIVEGCVVESLKNNQGKSGITYYWDEKQNGFIRNKEDEITDMPENLNNIVVYSN